MYSCTECSLSFNEYVGHKFCDHCGRVTECRYPKQKTVVCGTCGKPYNEFYVKQYNNDIIERSCPLCKKGRLQYFAVGVDTPEEAEEEDLKVVEAKFGSNHPQVAFSLIDLGMTYNRHRKHEEAALCFKRAITITENASGDYLLVALSLARLALLYLMHGKLDKAELFYKKSLIIRGKIRGEGNPFVESELEYFMDFIKNFVKLVEAKELEK